MLRTYGPSCDGSLVDPAFHSAIPSGAIWIDLEQPTREEERLVENSLGIAIPTRDDLIEIEPSSRLYQENGALYMTLGTLTGVEGGRPTTAPIGFVLTDEKLVTVRYANPKPVRTFIDEVRRDPTIARDPQAVLVRLLDAILDRLADELEWVAAEIDKISRRIFSRDMDERRISARQLTALLTRIGRTQSLLAQIRESAVSAGRLFSFLLGSDRLRQPEGNGARDSLVSLQADASALSEHSNFLAGNLNFLLDASLGLISVEQNAAMKLFSWAALVFLPPTLIAGIYGMNFELMPELDETWGYPLALALMLASAVLPLWFLKRRGWI